MIDFDDNAEERLVRIEQMLESLKRENDRLTRTCADTHARSVALLKNTRDQQQARTAGAPRARKRHGQETPRSTFRTGGTDEVRQATADCAVADARWAARRERRSAAGRR
jgi:hypothetical protein